MPLYYPRDRGGGDVGRRGSGAAAPEARNTPWHSSASHSSSLCRPYSSKSTRPKTKRCNSSRSPHPPSATHSRRPTSSGTITPAMEDRSFLPPSASRLPGQPLRFRKAERRQRGTAIHIAITCHLMVMPSLGRHVPDGQPALMCTDPALNFLRDDAIKQTMPPRTLGNAGCLVAHLREYRGRARDPEPGHQIMWHGYPRLEQCRSRPPNRLSGKAATHPARVQAPVVSP